MSDPSIILLQHFRLEIDNGADEHEAYNLVTENLPHVFAQVRGRAMKTGHVTPIQPGQLYLCQYELILAGLHNEPIREISIGRLENGQKDGAMVVTCVVGKYPLS